MGVVDVAVIVAVPSIINVLTQLFAWRSVYSTDAYLEAVRKVDSTATQIERIESMTGNVGKREKELERLRQAAQADKTMLTGLSMRTALASIVGFVLGSWICSSLYAGVPVVRLPFTPIGWFQSLTHSGLPGEDYTEGSYLFLYVLGNMISSVLVSRAFGDPPKPKTGDTNPFSDMFASMQGPK